jgi:hypothetical protein
VGDIYLKHHLFGTLEFVGAMVALGVGGAALLLLFIGIHNIWDGVSYHVEVRTRINAALLGVDFV